MFKLEYRKKGKKMKDKKSSKSLESLKNSNDKIVSDFFTYLGDLIEEKELEMNKYRKKKYIPRKDK